MLVTVAAKPEGFQFERCEVVAVGVIEVTIDAGVCFKPWKYTTVVYQKSSGEWFRLTGTVRFPVMIPAAHENSISAIKAV